MVVLVVVIHIQLLLPAGFVAPVSSVRQYEMCISEGRIE